MSVRLVIVVSYEACDREVLKSNPCPYWTPVFDQIDEIGQGVVPIALGKHLFPYRTQKLSLAAVTILLCGKIARCHFMHESDQKWSLFAF